MTATRVVFDEIGVRVTRWNGLVEQVSWDDLDSVLIETNDSGPIGTDLLWILAGKVSGCLVPGGAKASMNSLSGSRNSPASTTRPSSMPWGASRTLDSSAGKGRVLKASREGFPRRQR
jgi:hypothetical protein